MSHPLPPEEGQRRTAVIAANGLGEILRDPGCWPSDPVISQMRIRYKIEEALRETLRVLGARDVIRAYELIVVKGLRVEEALKEEL